MMPTLPSNWAKQLAGTPLKPRLYCRKSISPKRKNNPNGPNNKFEQLERSRIQLNRKNK
jgi:hypothetical protein